MLLREAHFLPKSYGLKHLDNYEEELLLFVVLTLGSHYVVNQVDRRYLAYLPSPWFTIL